MTLESIWNAIQATVVGFESTDGVKYEPARDGFSFELDPRGDVPAFYVEPPQVDEGPQYVGGGGALLARCSIWLSRPRGEDPDRQALGLATDCGELRRRIDEVGVDWFVVPGSATVRVSTGEEGQAVTVTGALSLAIDFEEV